MERTRRRPVRPAPTPLVTPELPTAAKARSDIMVGRRQHDRERETRGRGDLCAANIRDAIQREIAKSPVALTPKQIKLLAGLLGGDAK